MAASDGPELADARRRAVRWLAAAARSEAEIRQRLERGGFAGDVIEQTIAWLRRLGYLDDARLAAEVVAARKRYRIQGRVGVAWDLRRRGVDAALVKRALGSYDVEEEKALAVELAARRAPPADEPLERAYRRLAGFLLRRGFSPAAVRHALRIVLGDRAPGDALEAAGDGLELP
ncbi:MAG TPA: regulatory protein RecX [Limnochordia bacterium]